MEGGGRSGNGSGGAPFPYGNLNFQTNSLQFLHPRPPITAIDRFLWEHNHHFPSPPQRFLNHPTLFTTNVGAFPPAPSSINCHAGGGLAAARGGCSPPAAAALLPWPYGFNGGIFMDGGGAQSLNWNSPPPPPPPVDPNEVTKLDQRNSRATGRKEKGMANSMPLIKGQWTEGEDR